MRTHCTSLAQWCNSLAEAFLQIHQKIGAQMVALRNDLQRNEIETVKPLKNPEAPSRNFPSLLMLLVSKIVRAEIE